MEAEMAVDKVEKADKVDKAEEVGEGWRRLEKADKQGYEER